MRKDDVPQENNRTLGGHRKAVYAVDEDGRVKVVPSTGWSVEETVTSLAISDYEEKAEAIRKGVLAGAASPLEYYMWKSRLDLATLAQEAGFARWRVRRHLKPKVFNRLNRHILQRYAQTLGLTVEQIQTVPNG